MRAMVFDRYGEPDVMHLKDMPVPEPQDDEVLIRVGYSGVNPADSKTRATRAHLSIRRLSIGHRHGYRRYRGTNGANVTDFRKGDRVITWGSPDGKTSGSYAEFVRASSLPMPTSLNFAQAAAVPIASLTAFQSLFHAQKGGTPTCCPVTPHAFPRPCLGPKTHVLWAFSVGLAA
jgi:NADPH2:quinone reductase